MEKIIVSGMTCPHCVKALQEALEEMGLTAVQVNLESGTASFTPTTAFTEQQIRDAVDDVGFELESCQ